MAVTPTAVPPTLTDPSLPATITASPFPTPTQSAIYKGALTASQQELLNTSAQAYLSETPDEAVKTVIRMAYTNPPAYANPATVCGPLSLAILQDTGLVSKDFLLHDFWYLNPRPQHQENYLKKVFPADQFEKIEQPLPIDKVDYTADPLYPGDFLYLFAGNNGSYEHMLVVSRVDEAGRAYSVTNLNTTYGVIITEVMLYDPAQPGVGQFYEWTNFENRKLGRTGYGGFWLWRPINPLTG